MAATDSRQAKTESLDQRNHLVEADILRSSQSLLKQLALLQQLNYNGLARRVKKTSGAQECRATFQALKPVDYSFP